MADISVTLRIDDSQYNRAIKAAETNAEKFGKTFNDGIKSTNKTMDSMKTSLTNIEKELQKLGSAAKSNVESTNKLFASLKTTIASISFGALILDATKLSAEIVNTAKSLNISTAAAYGFQKAIAAAGGDADNARDGLISLSQKLGEAKTQGGDALAAFNALGISLTDLSKNSTETMIIKTVKALGNMNDVTKQSSIISRVFGEDLKNTNFKQAGNEIDGYTAKARTISPALEAAQKAQKDFNNTYRDFQDLIVANIPWKSLDKGLQTLNAMLPSIISLGKAILALGTAYLILANPLAKASALMGTVSVAATTLGTGLYKLVGLPILNFFRLLAANAEIVGMAFMTLFKGLPGGMTALSALSFGVLGLVQVLGRLTIIGTVAYAFSEFFHILTGKSLVDELTKSLRELFDVVSLFNGTDLQEFMDMLVVMGLVNGDLEESTKRYDAALEKYLGTTKKATDEVKNNTDVNNENNNSIDDSISLLEQHAKAANDLTEAFRKQSNQQIQSMQDQMALNNMGEDYKSVYQEIINLDNARIAKLDELNAKLKESEIAKNPELAAKYKQAINDVNAAYKEQVQEITNVANANVKDAQSKRLIQFQQDQLIEATKKYQDMVRDNVASLLPEEARAYYEIERAAQDALVAALNLEAKSRGLVNKDTGLPMPSALPDDVVKSYVDASRAGVDMQKQQAKANIDTRRSQNLLNFEYQDGLDTLRQINDIENENLDTLSWQDRIQKQLVHDAENRARAEINAENAKRGLRGEGAMLASEEAKYMQATIDNANKVAKARIQAMNETRTFAYGWKAAMQQYVEESGNAARKASAIFGKMMSGMEDLIVNFVKTGKFEWKNFLAMMLEELLRAQIQAVFASMIGDMTGALKNSSGGGLLSSLFGGSSSGGGVLGTLLGGLGKLFGIGGNSNTGTGTNTGTNGTDTTNTGTNGNTGGSILDSFWNGLKDVTGGIWDGLKNIGSGIVDGLSSVGSWLGNLGSGLLDSISSLGSFLGGVGSSLWSGLGSIGSGIWSGLSGLGSLFAGFFATGGTIPAGQTGMVAEKGPELVNGKLITEPTLITGPATVEPVNTYTIPRGYNGDFSTTSPVATDPNTPQVAVDPGIGGSLQDMLKTLFLGKSPYATTGIKNNTNSPYSVNANRMTKYNPYGQYSASSDSSNVGGNWSIGNVVSLINSGKLSNRNGFITMQGEVVPTNVGLEPKYPYDMSGKGLTPANYDGKKILEGWMPHIAGFNQYKDAYDTIKTTIVDMEKQLNSMNAKKGLLTKDPYAIMDESDILDKDIMKSHYALSKNLNYLKDMNFAPILPYEGVIPNAPNGFYASWWLNEKLQGKPALKSKMPENLNNGMTQSMFRDQGVKKFTEDDINGIFAISNYLDGFSMKADSLTGNAADINKKYRDAVIKYEEELAAAREKALAEAEKARKDPWNRLLGIAGMVLPIFGPIGAAISAGISGARFAGLFAQGGHIPQGYWGIAGEAGPEVVHGPANITPLKDNGPQNITYNINAVDARSFKQMIAADPSFIHGVVMQAAKRIPMRG